MELLAPAGTYDCLRAAVNSGANAVYFAGQAFGARSYAGNLSDEEIYRAADFCHLRDVKAYVTVNTTVYDREYKELERFVKTLTLAGIDAVIVQDLGVLKFIREMSPDIELHASTQMTIHSADGVRELEKLGASRVVLSRELSKSEIADIIAGTSAEAEVFVHGAMCMSYSGQCLMSSVIGGRSGNRGRCAQPCRLTYSMDGKSGRHYMSLKDMSLANHIGELRNIGVASLKIEGRMKGEEYVSTVVSTYRRLIDEDRAPTDGEIDSLNRVFYRGGITDGYFCGNIGQQMFAFDREDNPYLKNDKKAEAPGEIKMKIDMRARFREGEKPHLQIRYKDLSAEVCGEDVIQKAAKRPSAKTDVANQLKKTGGTAFEADKTEIDMTDDLFIPIGMINALRRAGIAELEDKILAPYRNKRILEAAKPSRAENRAESRYTCSVLNIGQYRAAAELDFALIYVPLHVVEENIGSMSGNADRIVVSPPVILHGDVRDEYKKRLHNLKDMGFNKVEVYTADSVAMAEGFERYGSHRLNVTNGLAYEQTAEMGLECICLSAELNTAQMRDIRKSVPCEAVVYGRLPIMITENCILKNMGGCPCGSSGKFYDRTGAEFIAIRDGDICRSVVLNSVPLYMGDKTDEIKSIGADFLRLIFTDESPAQCREIYDMYVNQAKNPKTDFTRLNFTKPPLM